MADIKVCAHCEREKGLIRNTDDDGNSLSHGMCVRHSRNEKIIYVDQCAHDKAFKLSGGTEYYGDWEIKK